MVWIPGWKVAEVVHVLQQGGPDSTGVREFRLRPPTSLLSPLSLS